jgi:multidrug efflux pump subunit AcrA (membrane-fusion protein)
VRRNRALEAVAETLRTLPIRNALLVPLMQDEAEVGVLEAVNKAVAQSDVALVRRGDHAAVKLDSYPQRSWHGAVDVVSPQAQAGEEGRTFAARVSLPNSNAILRAGMTGRAKIFIGYRPAGYVLLRKPALWLWQLLWNWIGW